MNINSTCREQVVPLPQSVESLLDRICSDQNQTPPDSTVRRALADIGEQEALEILKIISSETIRRSLNGFIMHMINKRKPPNHPLPSSSPPPNKAHRLSYQGGIGSSPVAEHLASSERGAEEAAVTPVLVALGELEFRKAFLLLNYAGGVALENAITADQIRNLKELPMEMFEIKAWETVGQRCLADVKERRLSHEWDSGKPYVYHCHVSTDGNLSFKGPDLRNSRTHLQKSLGDDNVLLVKFAEEGSEKGGRTSSQKAISLYGKFGSEGIRIGLRLYRFFVFKDGGKEEKKKNPTTSSVKCYFVRMESRASVDERQSYILSNKTMSEARCLFMHAHTLTNVTKYMARYMTWQLLLLTIPDEPCKNEDGGIVYDGDKPCIHTDGTGFISEDLAALCPKNVFKGTYINKKTSKGLPYADKLEGENMAMGKAECSSSDPPLLIQFRLFHMGSAIKGTLMLNKKLPPKTIQVRPKMIKVKTDSDLLNVQKNQIINSMEIVGTSKQPKKAYLSRNLIALLSYGGVPNEYFLDILKSALEEAESVFSSKRAALRVSINHGGLDDFAAARMILCGIPLHESYLQHHLSILRKEEMKSLRAGKLHVSNCYYLMGTVDPTKRLRRDQVCIILENGQISGDVLVYRNPGLHFGDIHVMRATYVKELESYVGHGKYAIFFPCVGPRSVADEIAGGDYDGDMYWVSTNSQLLKYFRKSDPWVPNSSSCNKSVIKSNPSVVNPSALSEEVLEDALFNLFLSTRFQPSYVVGAAAESWVALMDRLLTLRDDCDKEKQLLKDKILKLIDIYYEALDAPKKGEIKVELPKDLKVEIFPHYMERENSFTSTSILGLIYDEVKKYQTKQLLDQDIRKLACFDVEIPPASLKLWESNYEEYRKDMSNALKKDSEVKKEAAEEVIKKYKQKLYGDGATDLENSKRNIEDIHMEALALYNVTYDYAMRNNDVASVGLHGRLPAQH
ncbi:hypothetical protein L6164_005219 [Bauhinia variegata]|uniref:Uncharacterized protein n=1 Tax=Bauhinia variegata TaxID=167791 RepID=A0ACB9PPQ7_BAUVA|nr:hypothetical protein L6164_005219 [Bauhinia variegata]